MSRTIEQSGPGDRCEAKRLVVPILLLLLSGPSPCDASGEPLEIYLVMDNSASMAESDSDFVALACADMVLSMLRPDDVVHLVSAGTSATIVKSGTGAQRQEFRAALRRLPRESAVSDMLSVFDLVTNRIETTGMAGRTMVLWFAGRGFGWDPTRTQYLEGMIPATGKPPWGSGKPPPEIQAKIAARVADIVTAESGLLGELGVPVHMVLMGKQFSGPGKSGAILDEQVPQAMAITGGSLITASADGTQVLASVLAVLVKAIGGPARTIVPATYARKGESFEVLRGCRHLWVVILFQRPPAGDLGFCAGEPATEVVREWPFGKPAEDVFAVEPFLEKGLEHKDRRWYRLPEHPVGYAMYSIGEPLPGNYEIAASFDPGVQFVMRIVQEVPLEYGFLDRPPSSLPLGAGFDVVTALKSPEGYSYVFDREFVTGLRFQVLVRSQDGSIPEWGEVRDLYPGREGEAELVLLPGSPGVYFIKGKVTHSSGEFTALMKPQRFVVFERIALEFEKSVLGWRSSAEDGWVDLEPPLRVADGIEIPSGVELHFSLDPSAVPGSNDIEFQPSEFSLGAHRTEVTLRVRLGEEASAGAGSERYRGIIAVAIDESQKRYLGGNGRWEIPVDGRFGSWSPDNVAGNPAGWIVIACLVLLAVLGVLERQLRPSFPRDLKIHLTEFMGGKERTTTIDAGARPKPFVPFRRSRVVVGRGGDAGFTMTRVMCEILPSRSGIMIFPRNVSVGSASGGQPAGTAKAFAAEIGTRYGVDVGDGRVGFVIERTPGDAGDGKGDHDSDEEQADGNIRYGG